MSARWELHCDRPGCTAVLVLARDRDSIAKIELVASAYAAGWQLITWVGPWIDLCPEHVQPELGMKPPITDLSKRKGPR